MLAIAETRSEYFPHYSQILTWILIALVSSYGFDAILPNIAAVIALLGLGCIPSSIVRPLDRRKYNSIRRGLASIRRLSLMSIGAFCFAFIGLALAQVQFSVDTRPIIQTLAFTHHIAPHLAGVDFAINAPEAVASIEIVALGIAIVTLIDLSTYPFQLKSKYISLKYRSFCANKNVRNDVTSTRNDSHSPKGRLMLSFFLLIVSFFLSWAVRFDSPNPRLNIVIMDVTRHPTTILFWLLVFGVFSALLSTLRDLEALYLWKRRSATLNKLPLKDVKHG